MVKIVQKFMSQVNEITLRLEPTSTARGPLTCSCYVDLVVGSLLAATRACKSLCCRPHAQNEGCEGVEGRNKLTAVSSAGKPGALRLNCRIQSQVFPKCTPQISKACYSPQSRAKSFDLNIVAELTSPRILPGTRILTGSRIRSRGSKDHLGWMCF